MIRSREIAGWLLILLGLGVFGVTYFGLLLRGRIVESGPMVFIGFIIFRGGIHLLKVALAAKICDPTLEVPSKAKR